jgi:thioredoxin 1
MIVSITADNHDKEIKQSSKPVVLDIYASWCGPCQQMEPYFEELEKEMRDDYKFAKLNVDESREISIKEYGVTSIPTIVFIKDGHTIGKEVGYMDKETLQDKIKSAFKK